MAEAGRVRARLQTGAPVPPQCYHGSRTGELRRMQRLARTLVWLTVALVAASRPNAESAPWAQTPVFRATSDIVEIAAVVTNKAGTPVRGLARDDFLITEDGAPQELLLFSFVDIPLIPASTAVSIPLVVEPDVVSNVRPADARLYVIVLDGFHVQAAQSTVVRKLARQFITDSTGPHDQVAVVVLGSGGSSQPFTSDKGLLTSVVNRFIGEKSQSATLNTIKDGLNKPVGEAAEDFETGAKANEARRMLASLKQVCDSLGANQGYRRSVVLFSEGIDFDTTILLGQTSVRLQGARGSATRRPVRSLDSRCPEGNADGRTSRERGDLFGRSAREHDRTGSDHAGHGGGRRPVRATSRPNPRLRE